MITVPGPPGGPGLMIALAILILLLLVVAHEAGHHIAARRMGVKVLEFGVGWPPRLLSREWRGTRYSLNLFPIGAFVRMLGENEDVSDRGSYSAQPVRSRALILVAGPLVNLLLAPLIFAAASMVNDFDGVEISSVASGSPAEAAGMLPGDVLVRVGGTEIAVPADVAGAVAGRGAETVQIEATRDGAPMAFGVVPRLQPPPGQGPLGIAIRPHTAPAPPQLAIPRGFERAWQATILLPRYFGAVIAGQAGLQLSGPVGIVNEVGEAARQGPESVLFLAAIITAQLGIINLLPWPGLDGGRLLLLAMEAVRGRRLPVAKEGAINFFGIILLLTLAVLVTVGDVRRIAGG